MTDTSHQHDYQIGDAVPADMNGAQIPGVVEDKQDGKLYVRLSEPWADENGQHDQVWLRPENLSAYLEEETGGQQALPS